MTYPINTKTQVLYSGKNRDILRERNYTSNEWGTWSNWKEQGRLILKGEKGTKCWMLVNDNWSSFTLFNKDQTKLKPEWKKVKKLERDLNKMLNETLSKVEW